MRIVCIHLPWGSTRGTLCVGNRYPATCRGECAMDDEVACFAKELPGRLEGLCEEREVLHQRVGATCPSPSRGLRQVRRDPRGAQCRGGPRSHDADR
jgi:hypothetical protein